MSRARLATIVGILLLVAACLLPCVPFGDWAGGSLPPQDAPPDVLERQAAEIAAARHRLVLALAGAGVLAALGVAALVHGRRRRGGEPGQ
ncbi:hypothetical protein [Micromonospora siamensis]|uniref:Uncharacterized protein n=1 Tax=Micromonospora siamensis TaxID=299152 RepID=A0A1C5IEA8_9ACTN|nr:hypothetical protein [Micromonospora siamensis]SCG56687.1 hypothetical protein GA0074704_3295 [Micromonospora siamensis]